MGKGGSHNREEVDVTVRGYGDSTDGCGSGSSDGL